MNIIKSLLVFFVLDCISFPAVHSRSIAELRPEDKGMVPNSLAGVFREYPYGMDSIRGVRKIKDILIYKDPNFYSSFPSIVKKPNGEFLLAFRRAPDRKIFGESHTNHVDPNSYLVSLRSKDGENWTKEPELIYAHPFGGSQDPCLLQLRDGTLLCTSYGWAFVRPEGMENLKKPYFLAEGAVFLGGYLVRSKDGGKNWAEAIYPLHIQPEININPIGKPVPAYNRGALYEGKSGRIFWTVTATDAPDKT